MVELLVAKHRCSSSALLNALSKGQYRPFESRLLLVQRTAYGSTIFNFVHRSFQLWTLNPVKTAKDNEIDSIAPAHCLDAVQKLVATLLVGQ